MIDRHGPMVKVTTDRGGNFVSQLASVVLELWGVDKHNSTSWRPQTNGLVERFNGTMKTLMKEYVEDVGSSWSQGLGWYMFAYRLLTFLHNARQGGSDALRPPDGRSTA